MSGGRRYKREVHMLDKSLSMQTRYTAMPTFRPHNLGSTIGNKTFKHCHYFKPRPKVNVHLCCSTFQFLQTSFQTLHVAYQFTVLFLQQVLIKLYLKVCKSIEAHRVAACIACVLASSRLTSSRKLFGVV